MGGGLAAARFRYVIEDLAIANWRDGGVCSDAARRAAIGGAVRGARAAALCTHTGAVGCTPAGVCTHTGAFGYTRGELAGALVATWRAAIQSSQQWMRTRLL